MDAVRLQALELARGRKPAAAEIRRVAERTSPEAAAWAFTQLRLRESASAKFARASDMLFVGEALEQATAEPIAAFHASRFPVGAVVADLTVGIGADLIALARRGPAFGFEIDPERAECASHNLGVYGLDAEIVVGDCLEADWSFEYAFSDPGRRVAGRRTADPEQFAPNPRMLCERFAGLRLAGMKLSPLLADPFLESLGTKIEFVSLGWECREALVWCGSEADEGRIAVLADSGEQLASGGDAEVVPWAGRYLYEADPAAIRAHCLGTLCRRHDLAQLADSNGYLTGDGLVESPWLRGYRVLRACKADDKALKVELAKLDASIAAAKSRAAGVDVVRLVKHFKSAGTRQVVLVVYAEGPSRRYSIVEPID